jgi:hypothetical protein
VRIRTVILIQAALLLGAAVFPARPVMAGSCCGGGSGSSLVLPKIYDSIIDVSTELEKYDGFWDQYGKYLSDPVGSDLRQYRLNLGYARRINSQWQTSVSVPYVWNVNKYSGLSSRENGIGDTTMNLWYEALEDLSAWKIRTPQEFVPSVLIGPSLVIPTGISPYDNVTSSFDVTGRGFYRLDGNLLVTKTYHPWSASLALAYGTYLRRAVNREYGMYVEPYHKRLGDRSMASVSLSYISYIGTGGDALTGTASFIHLREDDATINGSRNSNSGFMKDSVTVALAWSSTDNDWTLRLSWNHSFRQNGWGEDFPVTDIYTIGVSYGLR